MKPLDAASIEALDQSIQELITSWNDVIERLLSTCGADEGGQRVRMLLSLLLNDISRRRIELTGAALLLPARLELDRAVPSNALTAAQIRDLMAIACI
ncbi:hypothetical protein [Variovorax sp. UC122_21]|uniref:hypothetical protein n=1 Tax=Variovorax sp. UC122_21 TaxID=3374554 RepID=UPI0037566AB6